MEQLDFKILDSNIDKYPRRLTDTDLLFFGKWLSLLNLTFLELVQLHGVIGFQNI